MSTDTTDPSLETDVQPAPPPPPATDEDPAVERARELERLARAFGLNAKQTQDLAKVVEARGLEYVQRQAELTSAKTRKNPAGFFLSALRDDYHAPKPPTPKEDKKRSRLPQEGPEGWQQAFRDLCKERYPAANPRGWQWAALAPSMREEIQEWMRERAEPQIDLVATERLWREAPDQQREAWRQDEMLRHFEPKADEKPGMAFLARLHLLTNGDAGEAPAPKAPEPDRTPAPASELPAPPRGKADEAPSVPVVRIEIVDPDRCRVWITGRAMAEFQGPHAGLDAQRCVAAWLVAELDRDGGFGATRAAIQDRLQADRQKENARLRGLLDAALRAQPHELAAWREDARKALQPPAPPAPWVLTPQERNVVIEALRGRRGPEADALLKRLLPKAPEQEPRLVRFSRSEHTQDLWRRAEARHGKKEGWTAEFHSKVADQIMRMVQRAEKAAAAGLHPDVEEEVYRYRRNLTKELEKNLKGASDEQLHDASDRLDRMVEGKRKALMEGRGRLRSEEGDEVPSLDRTHERHVQR
jgi:hypothetical protein